jgi:NO-binding membrane sensor protein with MHYT domain
MNLEYVGYLICVILCMPAVYGIINLVRRIQEANQRNSMYSVRKH